MSFVKTSDNFSVDDDDGFLQNSFSRAGLFIDNEGIVRADDLDIYRHVTQGRWADSGIGGDRQSSTSTLQHLHVSFNDDDDESINISELEASKDDLSFDDKPHSRHRERSSHLMESLESTLDKPQNYRQPNDHIYKGQTGDHKNPVATELNSHQLFSKEYYQQLHDLGVLVDGIDLSRDSVDDLEETSTHPTSQIDDQERSDFRLRDRSDMGLRDSQDLIGEYLESEMMREQEENADHRESEGRGEGRVDESSEPELCRTISNEGFPEEDDVQVDRAKFGRQGQSQQLTQGDSLQRNEDKAEHTSDQNHARSVPHLLQQSEPQASGTGMLGQVASHGGSGIKDISLGGAENKRSAGSPKIRDHKRLDNDDDARSVSSDSAALHAWPTSMMSQVSAAPERDSTRRLSRTRSQESFHEDRLQSREIIQHKRLLPQPSSSEPNHSFRLKAKTSAIAGPIRPSHATSKVTHLSDTASTVTHLSDTTSKVTHLSDTEEAGPAGESSFLDKSAVELSNRLTQEAQKRKQATELVQQLQADYGNLLTKYALAELTIDQMRLGAKITLQVDTPTPGQAQPGFMSGEVAHSSQVVSVKQLPGQGVQVSSLGQVTDTNSDRQNPLLSMAQKSKSLTDLHKGSTALLRLSAAVSDDRLSELSSPAAVEVVRADLMAQADSMNDRLESFSCLLDSGQLILEDQVSMFDEIKDDHDQLRRAYLKVKGDYNVLRRSGTLTSDSHNFDDNKELEGKLFRLGMRFEDVHERVEDNQKERLGHRQPFQASSSSSNNNGDEMSAAERQENSMVPDTTSVTEGRFMQQNFADTDQQAGEPQEDWLLENRVYKLRQDYNTNMDAYRKLKYLSNTPDGERQIEHVVLKLNEICMEMPDMFRLSPEIQDRRDKMLNENKLKMNERKSSVWEKLNQREQEMKQQRMSPISQLPGTSHSHVLGRKSEEVTPIIVSQRTDNSESLHSRTDVSSRPGLISILPDRMDRPLSLINGVADCMDRPASGTNDMADNSRDRNFSQNNNHGYPSHDPDQPSSRSGTSVADHSFSDSGSTYKGHNISSQSLPRPRRHEHGMRDPKLSQIPDMGSAPATAPTRDDDDRTKGRHQGFHGDRAGTSTQGFHGDSQEDMEGALAALPGPGKLKQLSKRREADDADSGFIGSMVGSGVGLPPELQQQQQQSQQQHAALRLTAAAANESATQSDQSVDSADQSMDSADHRGSQPGHQRIKVKADKPGTSRGQGDSTQSIMEGDATESDVSFRPRGKVSTTHTSGGMTRTSRGMQQATSKAMDRQKDKKNEDSYDATLEENGSEESDMSTPRASSQPESVKKSHGSDQGSTNQKIMIASNRQAGLKQPIQHRTETQDDMDKEQWNTSDDWQSSQDDRSTNQKMPDSASQSSRPPSRGSPTTDLYHTKHKQLGGGVRQPGGGPRHAVVGVGPGQSGVEVASGQGDGGVAERNKQREDVTEIKLMGQQLRRGRRHQDLEPGQNQPGLPVDHQNSGVPSRGNEFEERSVGSEVEVGSTVTRTSSVASGKLRALQEEIERLKEGVARANERSIQPPQMYHISAAPAVTPGQQEPEYYDPFDDPYGFMRMPRRRANSFSGGRQRDWDEWYWTLPQNRQYDGGDIPLGYAAADAYADPSLSGSTPGQHMRTTREDVRNRLRQRRAEHKNRRDLKPRESAPGAGVAANQQQQAGAAGPTAAFYLPSRSSAQHIQQKQRAAHSIQHQPQTASQGYLAPAAGPNTVTESGAYTQPWYEIQRLQRPSTSQHFQPGVGYLRGRVLSHDNISSRSQPGTVQHFGLLSRFHAGPAERLTHTTGVRPCPTCQGLGYHTHASHIHMDQPHPSYPPPHYSHISTRKGRQRSRSASRTRHSPGSSQHSLQDNSYMFDSDEEETTHRSLSRGRSRTGSRHRSQDRRSSHRSDSFSDQSDDDNNEDASLEHSLGLSVRIGHMTKKMLGTVSSELRKSWDVRELGSSYW